MQIRVLGCSGSIAAGSRTTSFLLDDDMLIDAGTGVGDLTLDEMARIDHILVSHSHLDHVLSIGLLADSVTRRRAPARPPVQVHALPQTLDALRQHVFNGVIWPDFTRLPSAEHPVLAFEPFEIGQILTPGQRSASRCCRPRTPCRPCGFAALRRRRRRLGLHRRHRRRMPALWRDWPRWTCRPLVIETAFGDDEQALAQISQHLCPALLEAELARLAGRHRRLHHPHQARRGRRRDGRDRRRSPARHRIRALVTGQVMQLAPNDRAGG